MHNLQLIHSSGIKGKANVSKGLGDYDRQALRRRHPHFNVVNYVYGWTGWATLVYMMRGKKQYNRRKLKHVGLPFLGAPPLSPPLFGPKATISGVRARGQVRIGLNLKLLGRASLGIPPLSLALPKRLAHRTAVTSLMKMITWLSVWATRVTFPA